MSWTEQTPLGKCRRRILIRATATGAQADVEDDAHRFGIELTHDGRTVQSVRSRSIRFPYTICEAADGVTGTLEGAPITTDTGALARFGAPGLHCTHRFDLIALACAQAARGPGERDYEVSVGPSGDRQLAVLLRDGQEVLRWEIEGNLIHAADGCDGQDVRQIAKWARSTGDDELVEAVLVLRRGLLVAHYRRQNTEKRSTTADVMPAMAGACYAFQPETAPHGISRPGNFQDFDAHRERLLADLRR